MEPRSTETRARAKDTATENLFRKVEQGSIPHIVRLGSFSWPSDSEDGTLALRIVFSLLRNEPTPRKPRFATPSPVTEEMAQQIRRIRHTVEAVRAPLEVLARKSETDKAIHASIFEENMSTTARWLSFIIRESSWVYSDEENPETVGPMVAAEIMIRFFFPHGTRDLIAAFKASSEMIAVLLSLYTWRNIEGQTISYLYATKPKPSHCAVAKLMQLVTPSPGVLHDLRNTIRGYSAARLRRFINSALLRIQEWTSLAKRRQLDTVELPRLALLTIRMIQEFLDIPNFAKVYLRIRFAPRALKLAMEFPNLPADDDRAPRATYPIAVSIYFFPNEPAASSAHLIHHLVPDLVNGGLLQLLLDHLLSQREGTSYPWYPWVENSPTGHPLPILASMAVYKPIRDAIGNAINAIPLAKLKTLEGRWYSQHWKPFLSDYKIYDHIWHHQKAYGKSVILCDNLNHHERFPPSLVQELPEARQCSGCRTVVYCSTSCQQEDWMLYHKDECLKHRVYRIAREIESAWVPHRDRSYFAGLLQHYVLNFEVGAPMETIVGRLEGNSVLVYHYPHGWRPSTDIEKMTKKHILEINTLSCPPRPGLLNLDTYLNVTHNGIPTYRDPRYLALYRDFQASVMDFGDGSDSDDEWMAANMVARVRLATLTAFCGVWRIYIMGRFIVVKDSKSAAVTMQGVFVKIEERAKIEEGGVRVPL
ncbi:hypothetical protein D9611_006747 [Ephemerocybe angulata]|uniref:MYND-type domain-containing protein n=1 Tax=Ephemerocybe angulata TaxID=980116 RepID=A0A8H5FH21_9AGAR|nr:hypothetical protein D9611_006747 [Tulosesus angulatus]